MSVFHEPRVLAAVRRAMKAGHRNEVALIANVEEFAPPEVREAFRALVDTVSTVTLGAASPSTPAGERYEGWMSEPQIAEFFADDEPLRVWRFPRGLPHSRRCTIIVHSESVPHAEESGDDR